MRIEKKIWIYSSLSNKERNLGKTLGQRWNTLTLEKRNGTCREDKVWSEVHYVYTMMCTGTLPNHSPVWHGSKLVTLGRPKESIPISVLTRDVNWSLKHIWFHQIHVRINAEINFWNQEGQLIPMYHSGRWKLTWLDLMLNIGNWIWFKFVNFFITSWLWRHEAKEDEF